MYLHSPFKILAVGGSLVTSSSLWFFQSGNVPVAPLTLSSESSPNINGFEPVVKLETRNGTETNDANIQLNTSYENNGVFVTFKNNKPEGNSLYLSWVQQNIDNFKIEYVSTTKEEYKNFDKTSIKISLFVNPVWYSNTGSDEYQELESTKVQELFKDTDDVKVKQLLLSLHKREEWKLNGNTNYFPTLKYPTRLDDLKNLKIKYFKDFEGLKSYVLEKVQSCTDDTKSCVAHVDELDFMDTDKQSFYVKLWANK